MISIFQQTRAIFVVLICSAICGCASNHARTNIQPPPPVDTTRADKLIMQADAAADSGDLDKAISLYREAIVVDRDRYSAWNNLGVALMKRGDYFDAVSALKVAGDLSPRDPRPIANIGLAYQQMGWAADALGYYEQALERDPGFLEALRGYAVAEDLLGQGSLLSLERIKRALMVERDDQWRAFFERRRFRVQALLSSPDL